MHRLVACTALFASTVVLAACGRPSDSAEAAAQAAPPATAAAAKPGVQRAASAPLKPLAMKKFGTEITEKTATPLTQLVRTPSKFADQTVRTEGVVSAVCKSMGCWMELADEAGQAHIKMAGHSFFVPKDSAGHRALIQGKVINTPKDDECSEEARQQTGQVAKIEIEATGVEFLD